MRDGSKREEAAEREKRRAGIGLGFHPGHGFCLAAGAAKRSETRTRWSPPLICGPCELRTPHVIDPSSQSRSEKNYYVSDGCCEKRGQENYCADFVTQSDEGGCRQRGKWSQQPGRKVSFIEEI